MKDYIKRDADKNAENLNQKEVGRKIVFPIELESGLVLKREWVSLL